jgi:hypothetical protein
MTTPFDQLARQTAQAIIAPWAGELTKRSEQAELGRIAGIVDRALEAVMEAARYPWKNYCGCPHCQRIVADIAQRAASILQSSGTK